MLPELHREVNVARMAVERRSQEENKRFKRVTRQEAPPLSRDEQVWLQDRDIGL